MSCNNCYGGCSEIISDRCVRYTGIDISSLGIETGDSLSQITKSLTDFLLTVISGTGIKPVISEGIICELITRYLPTCGTLTIVDFTIALIKSVCDLQEQTTENTDAITALNIDYDVDCLTGVTNSTDTHEILQAVITKLCEVDTDLTDLAAHLTAFYSSDGAELDAYIANYLSIHSAGSGLMSNKMVPYVAYEYYGSLTGKFDANGVGLAGTDWVSIYICNGQNGTPDKRGRVAVGATDSPGPAFTDAAVNPAVIGNPTYSAATPGAWTPYGSNLINLNVTQVPNHTHTATVTATQDSHYHFEFNIDSPTGSGALGVNATNYATANLEAADNLSYRIKGTNTVATLGKTSTVTPTITAISTITSTSGGGYGHPNVQPGIAAYFIMYII